MPAIRAVWVLHNDSVGKVRYVIPCTVMQSSCPRKAVVVGVEVPVLVNDVVPVVVVVTVVVAVDVIVVVVGVVLGLVVCEVVAVEVPVEVMVVVGDVVAVVVGVDKAQSVKVPSAYEPTAPFNASTICAHFLSPRMYPLAVHLTAAWAPV